MTQLESADTEQIRSDFPVFGKPLPNGKPVVYLDSAASAQKPKQVIKKEMEVYENYFANAYRGVYYFGARVDEELEATRERIREFINAESADEIIFTAGTSMSINLVAYAWGRKFLQPDDEVLVNETEHHAILVPWQQIAKQRGAQLRYLPLTSDGQLDVSRLDEFLTEKTRLVAVSGMSNVLGTINPIDVIAAAAKERGALVLVDGAQSVPHAPVDVRNPNIDFLAFSGHKLYGPTGIGVLYGRRELLEAMDPFLYGGHMIERVYRDDSSWAAIPAKFEAGTIPIVQAIGLGTAVDYVKEIGFDRMHEIERRLLTYAFGRLSEIPGLRILGPPIDKRGSIVSFTIEGAHPEDLANLLDLKGVFVRHGHHCTMPLHDWLGIPASVRASFAIYNSESDIDALVGGIEFAKQKLRLV